MGVYTEYGFYQQRLIWYVCYLWDMTLLRQKANARNTIIIPQATNIPYQPLLIKSICCWCCWVSLLHTRGARTRRNPVSYCLEMLLLSTILANVVNKSNLLMLQFLFRNGGLVSSQWSNLYWYQRQHDAGGNSLRFILFVVVTILVNTCWPFSMLKPQQ